jgi:CRISPR-associated protein Csb2
MAFDFPARRYHATPRGRHVNEADVGWPPDPWRIARGLLFTWHRKLRPGEVPRETLGSLLEALNTLGEDRIPAVLSGHGASDHAHAFYLPGTHEVAGTALAGRIHHAIVFAPAGFDRETIDVLDRLRRVTEPDGRGWQLVLEGTGACDSFRSPLLEIGTEWISVTPYLHPWHRKPRFEVPDQIRRECRERDLPEVTSIVPVAEIVAGGRARRPIHFHRFRSKPGLTQPDRQGSFWRLAFAEPIRGPLALGFACHFGLGLFEPVRKERGSRGGAKGTAGLDGFVAEET